MPSIGDIKAGMAYVELYADDSLFLRGITKAENRVKQFGAFVSSIGRKMFLAGSTIFTMLSLAVKQFTNMGSELYLLSERTGVGVQALSEMKYAAEMTGNNLSALADMIKRTQYWIVSTAASMNKAAEAVRMYGINVYRLKGLKPEQQLEAVFDAISKLPDAARRSQAAMTIIGKFGSGPNLLPMIEHMAALRAQARALGLTMKDETARDAYEFGVVINTVHKSLKYLQFEIGAALKPLIDQLGGAILQGVRHLRVWIQQNQTLVNQIAVVTMRVMAAGVGLFLFGKTIRIVLGGVVALRNSLALLQLIVLPLTVTLRVLSAVLFSIAKGMVAAVTGIAGFIFSTGKSIMQVVVDITVSLGQMLKKISETAISVVIWVGRTAFSIFGVVGDIIANFVINSVDALFAVAHAMVAIVSASLAVAASVLSSLGAITATVIALSGMGLVLIGLGLLMGLFAGAVIMVGSAVAAVLGVVIAALKGIAQFMMNLPKIMADASRSIAAFFGSLFDQAVGGVQTLAGAFMGFVDKLVTPFQNLCNTLSTAWGVMIDDMASAWPVLFNALKTGDFEGAFAIITALAKLEWLRFAEWFAEFWNGNGNTIVAAMNAAMGSVVDSIMSTFATVKTWILQLWRDIRDGAIAIFNKIGYQIEKIIGKLEEYKAAATGFAETFDSDKGHSYGKGGVNGPGGVSRPTFTGIETPEDAPVDPAAEQAAATAMAQKIKDAINIPTGTPFDVDKLKDKKDVAEEILRLELNAQRDRQEAAAKERKETADRLKKFAGEKNFSDEGLDLTGVRKRQSKTTGTFSAFVAERMGIGPIDRMVKATEETAKNTAILAQDIARDKNAAKGVMDAQGRVAHIVVGAGN